MEPPNRNLKGKSEICEFVREKMSINSVYHRNMCCKSFYTSAELIAYKRIWNIWFHVKVVCNVIWFHVKVVWNILFRIKVMWNIWFHIAAIWNILFHVRRYCHLTTRRIAKLYQFSNVFIYIFFNYFYLHT